MNLTRRSRARPKRVYISSLATGKNDGSSWKDAYLTLATAIEVEAEKQKHKRGRKFQVHYLLDNSHNESAVNTSGITGKDLNDTIKSTIKALGGQGKKIESLRPDWKWGDGLQ